MSSFRRIDCGDFPGGPMVKNLPCNAGDMGWIPGQGTKIPHTVEQLSLSVTTTEPEWRNYWRPCALEPIQQLLTLRVTTGESVCPSQRPQMKQWGAHVWQLRPNTTK